MKALVKKEACEGLWLEDVPMVVGHEFVGEIVEVGTNVIDFHPGQIVSGEASKVTLNWGG
jgi:D-arabinose 1-dehydrogenase-like Zn-dependent alcohol dehydrogenase